MGSGISFRQPRPPILKAGEGSPAHLNCPPLPLILKGGRGSFEVLSLSSPVSGAVFSCAVSVAPTPHL